MIKAKPAASVPPVFFEYAEEFKIQIRKVSNDRRRELVRISEETTFDKKHQKTVEPNYEKFGRDFMLEAIVGWTGMTYFHLLDICTPLDLEPGVKLIDEIPFDRENLVLIADNYRPDFAAFIINAVNRLNDIYAEGKKKELENL